MLLGDKPNYELLSGGSLQEVSNDARHTQARNSLKEGASDRKRVNHRVKWVLKHKGETKHQAFRQTIVNRQKEGRENQAFRETIGNRQK